MAGLTKLMVILVLFCTTPALAGTSSGEAVYKRLTAASARGDGALFKALNATARTLDWGAGSAAAFQGNLRYLEAGGEGLYLVREKTGQLYVLALPEDRALLHKGASSPYAGLAGKRADKLNFKLITIQEQVSDHAYRFVQLSDKPAQVTLDRVFKVAIILMLFFVMVGMGLTLTLKDFARVFTKPLGIILGEVLQFGIIPLMALGLGHLFGFYESYPFIFAGMILVIVSPGGVTSNLMTHFAKGDLALSISLTSFSTILSIALTPLLLAAYCSNIPEVTIPVKTIVLTISVMVLVPLVLGMSIRGKWEAAATKAVPFFSALGIIALLFLIVTGVVSNLEKFADTERFGLKFYSMTFLLTFGGMFVGALLPKLFGINNFQARAISLESGLRNASLSMAIAVLIQDAMGDFHSSMFFVSGLFGLWMYVAGALSIFLFKRVLPVDPAADE